MAVKPFVTIVDAHPVNKVVKQQQMIAAKETICFFSFIMLVVLSSIPNVTCDLRGTYALGMKIVRFTA